MPTLTVIGGPNGSGKSTLTRSLDFPGKENLLDPDAIATGITAGDPTDAALAAGRAALERRMRFLQDGVEFAIETTLTGAGVINLMRQAKRRGYTVLLFFVALDDPELNVQRVRERVRQVGHSAPIDDIRRRCARSLANAVIAMRIADACVAFDNSGYGHVRVFDVERGRITWRAEDLPAWAERVLGDLGPQG